MSAGQDEEADARAWQAAWNSAAPSTWLARTGKAWGHEPVEEARGGGGCSASAGFEHVPAGDGVAGGEVFEHDAGRGAHVQGVHLDEVAGLVHGIPLRLADRLGAPERPLAAGVAAGAAARLLPGWRAGPGRNGVSSGRRSAADAEVPAGEGGVLAVGVVVVHPRQSDAGRSAQGCAGMG